MTDPAEFHTMKHRISVLEDTSRDIAESLKALVRLETHHAETREALSRAWKTIETSQNRIQSVDDQIPERLSERLSAIERDMPTLKLTSGWVVTFTLGGFGLAALLVWSLVTDPQRRQMPATIEPRTGAITPQS